EPKEEALQPRPFADGEGDAQATAAQFLAALHRVLLSHPPRCGGQLDGHARVVLASAVHGSGHAPRRVLDRSVEERRVADAVDTKPPVILDGMAGGREVPLASR